MTPGWTRDRPYQAQRRQAFADDWNAPDVALTALQAKYGLSSAKSVTRKAGAMRRAGWAMRDRREPTTPPVVRYQTTNLTPRDVLVYCNAAPATIYDAQGRAVAVMDAKTRTRRALG